MEKVNTVVTKAGDTAASLAAAFYGSSAHVVQVLEANPDLSRYPLLLPAGLKVVMPVIETKTAATIKTINLWD